MTVSIDLDMSSIQNQDFSEVPYFVGLLQDYCLDELHLSKIQFIFCKYHLQIKSCMNEFKIQTPDQLRPIVTGFRKSAQLTQAEMAVKLGVTQQTYSAAERNTSHMSVENLMMVLNTLGVELILRKKNSAGNTEKLDQTPQW